MAGPDANIGRIRLECKLVVESPDPQLFGLDFDGDILCNSGGKEEGMTTRYNRHESGCTENPLQIRHGTNSE